MKEIEINVKPLKDVVFSLLERISLLEVKMREVEKFMMYSEEYKKFQKMYAQWERTGRIKKVERDR